MKRKVLQKYKSFVGIIALLLIFGSPNLSIAILKLSEGAIYEFLTNIFHFLITCGLFLLPLLIFKITYRRYFLIIVPLSSVIPVILFTIFIYHKLPTRWMIYTLFEASSIDIKEFISNMWIWKMLLLAFPLSIITITLKLLPAKQMLPKKNRFYIALAIIFFILLTYSYKSFQRKSFDNSVKICFRTILRDTPVNSSQRFIKAYKSFKNNNSKSYRNLALNVKRTKDIGNREIIILILGESSRYENWGINNYFRSTSPKLETLENIISYKNIISPSFNTTKSIPIITSSAKALDYNTENHYSILSLYKQAGFKTYWLSNQTSKGSIIGAIAETADEYIQIPSSKNASFDEELLLLLNSILKKKEPRVLCILHTLGSHYPYQNRYPPKFEVFNPSLQKNRHIPLSIEHKESIINSYDNSILYTDSFLYNITQLINIDSVASSMVYISDHGENLFDYPHIGFGRGYGQLSDKLFHIPLFIWCNNEYKINNSDTWENLNRNKIKNGSSEVIIYTLADMSNLSWNNYNSSKSLASDKYTPRTRMYIFKNSLRNYDNLNKEKSEE